MQETRIIDPSQTYEAQGQGLPAGSVLLDGKFTIDRQIGAGGFGITYIAKDSFLERAVVIKECFPESICVRFGDNVTVNSATHERQYRYIVEMFMREARSVAKLRHPNIVSVHQAFEENGTAYMVLDLFDGRDLMDIIDDEDDLLSPDQIRDIMVKLLDAIDLVHRHDLLHRDISPDNILLDKWGSPALIDFGAAREDASKKTNDVSTMLVVKDGYSPHEFYISGSSQGPCSDLYALGATMYHLISGEAPPNSQTRVAELTNNNDDPYVPLAGRFPQYESSFLEAIDKAVSVPPKDRIQSANEWLGLIEQESKKVRTVNIPQAKGLTKTLSELIEETNKHVRSEALPPSAPIAKAPRAAKSDRYRPAWVDEFNRETAEVAARKRAEERAAAEAVRLAEKARLEENARLMREAQEVALTQQKKAENEASSPTILGWVARGRS